VQLCADVGGGGAGKLFPGPHLYAGAAIVVLWALAASLVPYMQKGNDTARSVHIAANTINLGLFAWQARPVLCALSAGQRSPSRERTAVLAHPCFDPVTSSQRHA